MVLLAVIMFKKHRVTILKLGFSVLLFNFLLTSCSSIEPWVKPYERQNLADPIMAQAHPTDDYYMSHAYENREAARGADGGVGGGCGCN